MYHGLHAVHGAHQQRDAASRVELQVPGLQLQTSARAVVTPRHARRQRSTAPDAAGRYRAAPLMGLGRPRAQKAGLGESQMLCPTASQAWERCTPAPCDYECPSLGSARRSRAPPAPGVPPCWHNGFPHGTAWARRPLGWDHRASDWLSPGVGQSPPYQ